MTAFLASDRFIRRRAEQGVRYTGSTYRGPYVIHWFNLQGPLRECIEYDFNLRASHNVGLHAHVLDAVTQSELGVHLEGEVLE